jgi:RNA-directed DNA polymerase
MKRIGNLYQLICSKDNLELADKIARKGKKHQWSVIQHDANRDENIQLLHKMLTEKTYRTSPYMTFTIREPKERIIYRLPYFPDRICHHAIMNILEQVFVSMFTADTYSCIKGKGIHGAHNTIKRALRDVPGTQYCLKLDIKKFYPSVDHDILKKLLRKKFKDNDLLWLLDEIIDSADGLPIGNYLSQYFANFYLTHFDHWVKEVMRWKYYFRYADDMIFLAATKEELHRLLILVREYLLTNLRLELKHNYQVFPVEARGIDAFGYVYRHDYVLLRKRTKKNFARMLARRPRMESFVAYNGWLKYCNSGNLIKKLIDEKFQRDRNKTINQKL